MQKEKKNTIETNRKNLRRDLKEKCATNFQDDVIEKKWLDKAIFVLVSIHTWAMLINNIRNKNCKNHWKMESRKALVQMDGKTRCKKVVRLKNLAKHL